MATYDDVLDMQNLDGKLDHREAIHIGMIYQIGDVSMDEYLARQQADDRIGRNTAVGTADPEIIRILLRGKVGEKIWLFFSDAFRPIAIVFEEIGDIFHVTILALCVIYSKYLRGFRPPADRGVPLPESERS